MYQPMYDIILELKVWCFVSRLINAWSSTTPPAPLSRDFFALANRQCDTTHCALFLAQLYYWMPGTDYTLHIGSNTQWPTMIAAMYEQQLLPYLHVCKWNWCSLLQACCTVPKAVAKDYTEKGKYIKVDGMQTCTSLIVHLAHFPRLIHKFYQMSPVRHLRQLAFSSFMTSSASAHKPNKARIF